MGEAGPCAGTSASVRSAAPLVGSPGNRILGDRSVVVLSRFGALAASGGAARGSPAGARVRPRRAELNAELRIGSRCEEPNDLALLTFDVGMAGPANTLAFPPRLTHGGLRSGPKLRYGADMARAPTAHRRYRRHDHISLAAVEFWGESAANPPDRMRAVEGAIDDPRATWKDLRFDQSTLRVEISPAGSKPLSDHRVTTDDPFPRSVDFGPALLVGRVGPPYPDGGWDGGVGAFFHRCATAFMEGFCPRLVRRIGIRYRNAFAGLSPAEIPLLFALRVVGEGAGADWLLAQQATSFDMGLVLLRGSKGDRSLALRFGVEPAVDGASRAILDMDYSTSTGGLPDAAAARALLDDGHEAIHDAFEAVITDALRERMDAP